MSICDVGQATESTLRISYLCYLGNDLARAFKWGGGYTGAKVMQVLYAVEDANTVQFDANTCHN